MEEDNDEDSEENDKRGGGGGGVFQDPSTVRVRPIIIKHAA